MVEDILALLRLFSDRVPDTETHSWVLALAADEERWPEAHDVFDHIRERTLAAEAEKDEIRGRQYAFEEICLKSLLNEADTDAPFDSDSPHWIGKCAIRLARAVGLPDSEVIAIIADR
jgi:hypothetical protein